MDLELLARTSAVLVAAGALAAMLRRAASATRHLVWHLAIVTVLLAPLLAPLAPAFAILPVPRVPAIPEVPAVVQSSELEVFAPTPGTAGTTGTRGTNLGTIGTSGTIGTLVWFLFCWLLSGVSVWRSRPPAPEWKSEADKIARRMGIRKAIDIREMKGNGSPHVAGFFRSVVMLPPAARTWPEEARHA